MMKMAYIQQIKNCFESWNESETPQWFETLLERITGIYRNDQTENKYLSLAEESHCCYYVNAFDLQSAYTHLQYYSKLCVRAKEATNVQHMLIALNQNIEQNSADLNSNNHEHYVRACILLGKVDDEKQFYQRVDKCSAANKAQYQQLYRCLQLVRLVNVMEEAVQFQNVEQKLATDGSCENPAKIMTNMISSAVRHNISFEKVMEIIAIYFKQNPDHYDIHFAKDTFKQCCLAQFNEELENIMNAISSKNIFEFEASTFNLRLDYYKYALQSVVSWKGNREVVDNILNESLVQTRFECKPVENLFRFLKCFRSFLCHTKDLEKICEVMRLNENSLTLQDVITNILELPKDASNDQLSELQDNAHMLIHSNLPFSSKIIFEIVTKLRRLPAVYLQALDAERQVIKVDGEHIVLSTVLERVEKELVSSKEVHFVCNQVFHIDTDLSNTVWHGVNVLVRTNLIKVHGSAVWNISGKDNNTFYSKNAGQNLNGEGNPGEDGFSGEGGGNLLILANSFENMKGLTIYSNGGNGSKGQDGGDGKNGKDTFGISKHEILDRYKLSALLKSKYLFEQNAKEYNRKIVDAIKEDCSKPVTEHIEGNNFFIQAKTDNDLDITYSFSWTTPVQWYFVVKGPMPILAKSGGTYGLGGHRGYPGKVSVECLKTGSKIIVEKHTNLGREGSTGLQGKSGRMGKCAWDIAFFKSGPYEPVCIGEEQTSRINIEYYMSKTEHNVFCWYNKRYTRISCNAQTTTQIDHSQISPITRENQHSARESRKCPFSKDILFASNNSRFRSSKEEILLEKLSKIQSIQNFVAGTPTKKQASQVNVERQLKIRHLIKLHQEPKVRNEINVTVSDIFDMDQVIDNSILDKLTVTKESLKFWQEIKKLRMKPEHFTDRFIDKWNMLVNMEQYDENSVAIKSINEIINVKYQLAKLEEVSRALYSKPWDVLAVDHMIEIEGFPSIHHEALGNMNEFFSNYKCKKQINKLSHYLKNPEDGVLEKPMKIFITEAARLDNADPYLVACNNQYLNFEQQHPDKQFQYGIWTQDEKILKAYIMRVCTKGPHFRGFRELLARAFKVNIRVYCQNEDGKKFLIDDHYPGLNKDQVNVLFKNRQFIQLKYDENFQQNEEIRCIKKKTYFNVISKSNILLNNTYRSNEELNDNFEDSIVVEIAQYVIEDYRESVLQKLQHIASNKNNSDILYSIFLRFTNEGFQCSLPEFEILLSCILDSKNEENDDHALLNWIVLSHPQTLWIHEIILIQLENYFETWLPQEFVWRQLLWNVKNKGILILLHSKLKQRVYPLSPYYMHQTLNSLAWVSLKVDDLTKLDLLHWCYALEQLFIKQNNLVETGIIPQADTVDSLSIDSEGSFESARNQNPSKHYEETAELNEIERCIKKLKIDNRTVDCTNKSLQIKVKSQLVAMIKRIGIENTIIQLKSLTNTAANENEEFYSKSELISIQNEKNLINDDVFLSELIEQMKSKTKYKICNPTILIELTANVSTLHSILNILNVPYASHINYKYKPPDTIPSDISSVFRRIDEVLLNKRGYILKEIQRNAVLTLVRDSQNDLVQVPTGEGKSLIIVAVAIIKVLRGESVDIVTSSSVLAKRDVEENKFIYDHFNICVAHNCYEDIKIRKQIYSNNQVIYGDIINFQWDYLLQKFFHSNVLGKRKHESIIIDEADSMLLDKGNEMLYLSHDLPDMDKLEPVYVFILEQVNRKEQQDNTTIKNAVLWQLYGILKKDDLDQLGTKFNINEKENIWQGLIEANIINKEGKLITETLDRNNISSCIEIDSEYLDRLIFLLQNIINREKEISIPNYLRSFVELHLESWIDAAKKALTMEVDRDYVLDIGRMGTLNITIIDIDTGTDLVDSEWDETLHQCIQLKHACRTSLQSLKAVFISYASFFKLYKNLLGLSGTFGSIYEVDKLKQIYNVNVTFLPPSNDDKFIEKGAMICANKKEWISAILTSADIITKQENRSILIICDTVKEVKLLHDEFKAKQVPKIRTYKREFENFGEEKLCQEEIIIATNLAGRGTNIQITDKLKMKGGLHVCLTYLPRNSRIEQQAFKRAARNGADGSGQLIVMDNTVQGNPVDRIVHLKQERDFREFRRIYEMKKYYECSITKAESWFEIFAVEYKKLSEFLSTSTFTKNNKKLIKLLLDSCLYGWAYWLDEKWESIETINNNSSFTNFLKPLKDLRTEKVENLDAWIDNILNNLINLCSLGSYPSYNPTQMTKLGMCLLQDKKSKLKKQAIELFDKVIKLEPNFSETAHYCKAYALSKDKEKQDFEKELRAVSDLLHTRIKNLKKNVPIIEKCSTKHASSILKIDDYKKQTDSFCELYYFIINSVDNILGHPVVPNVFTNGSIDDLLSRKIYDTLFEKGLLKKPTIRKDLTKHELKQYGKHHGIPPAELFKHLSGKMYGFNLIGTLKEKILLPSREKFWNELVKQNVLQDEKRYVIIDQFKLNELVPEWQEFGTEVINSQPNEILLYPLVHKQEKVITFEKKYFKDFCSEDKFVALKRLGVLTFQRKAKLKFDTNTISHVVFENFDSISLQDLTKANICEKDSQAILKYLEESCILIAKQQKEYVYDLLADSKTIQNLNLTPYKIYENIVKELIFYCFSYRLALKSIMTQCTENCYIPLPVKPHYCLFADLFMGKIFEPVRVGNFDKKDLKECLAIVTKDKNVIGIVELILKSMKAASGSITMMSLAEFGKLENEGERNLFSLNGFDMIFRVNPYSHQNMWIPIGLGVCEVVVGYLVSYVPLLSSSGGYLEKNGLRRISIASQIGIVHANHKYANLRSNVAFKRYIFEKTNYFKENIFSTKELTTPECYVRIIRCMINFFIPRLAVTNEYSKFEMVFKSRIEILYTHIQTGILDEIERLTNFNAMKSLEIMQYIFQNNENNMRTIFNQILESVMETIFEAMKHSFSMCVIRQIILSTVSNVEAFTFIVNKYKPNLKIIQPLQENLQNENGSTFQSNMRTWFIEQVSTLLKDCVKKPLMLQSFQQLRKFIELRVEFQLGQGMCDF